MCTIDLTYNNVHYIIVIYLPEIYIYDRCAEQASYYG